MYFKKSKPSDSLRKYIHCYWVAKVDGTKVLREINPSTNISVCFHLGHSANFRLLPNDFCKGQKVSFDTIIKWVNCDSSIVQNVIIGPHRRLMVETSENVFYALGIEFKTGMRKIFFGNKIINLSDKILPLDSSDILLSKIPTIISECRLEDMFGCIDKYLTNNLLQYIQNKYVDEDLYELIEEVSENPFDAKVSLMDDRMNTCLRNIEYYFKQYTGLTPKQFISIKKIKKVCECMIEHQESSLVEILESCGYYDQTHINRDFKIIGGLPATLVFENIKRQLTNSPDALCLNYDLEGVCGFNLLM